MLAFVESVNFLEQQELGVLGILVSDRRLGGSLLGSLWCRELAQYSLVMSWYTIHYGKKMTQFKRAISDKKSLVN